MKPRILVIVDVPGWALERTADNVMRRLSGNYDFRKAFNRTAAQALSARDYDLAYICYERQLQDAGIAAAVPRPAVIGVRCHSKWDGGVGNPPSAEFVRYLNGFDALHAPSKILCDIFSPLHPAVFHTPHGVDESVFTPRPARKPSPPGSLVLGWAGSRTNHPGKRRLETLLFPAVENLTGVELRIAAREDIWRTQEEMASFYQGLDACICTSRVEGGPHSLLEASATGVPVISTRVGIAPELIENGHNGLLVDGTVRSVREAVIRLRDERDLRVEMGRRARDIVQRRWTWDLQAPRYMPFFDYGLQAGQRLS